MSSKLSGPELVQLKNAVVDTFDESNWKELGALTNKLEEVESHDRLLRSLSWQDDDYDGHALTFLRKLIGDNDENLVTVKEYIESKSPNIGENISSIESEGRKIIFRPSIFEVPVESVDKQLVSVMMPFNSELSPVYETIKIASRVAGNLSCKRADDIWQHSTVIQDVFSLIFQSNIVVCDFTNKNPNVFYEAGIAHTLGKHVVPITQSEHDIPFDLQHHRYIKYLNNTEGLEVLKITLAERLQTLSSQY